MTKQNNAARVAVQAKPCPKLAPAGMPATQVADLDNLPDCEQLDIALQGTFEAEIILHHMLRNASTELEHAWTKAFILRLSTINSVCMSALSGKDFGTTEHMRQMLEGRP